ncbi:unnamed protein product [Gongylonema pulchrum]|uniref:Lactamase_B domain-containing protein n=1 Tax=Gongylonema pulchrum TaxID=637853 RepID=A0A183D1D1_9BILA|nr:unnamed protein product [Gongylonema pulchrum]
MSDDYVKGYRVEQLSANVYCIREEDYCKHGPLMYLIIETHTFSVRPYKVTRWLADEEVIRLGDMDSDELKVLHTPGHTPDSLTIWLVSVCAILYRRFFAFEFSLIKCQVII